MVPTKLDYFASNSCSRVLGYSAIDLKVCQESVVEKKELKDNVLEDMFI